MANYGVDTPATGFTFSLLNLLFALDNMLDQRVDQFCDLLIFAAGKNLRAAQTLACRLRKLGYSVSRDMLDRSQEDALAYARKMNYRYLAVVEDDVQDITLTALEDGSTKVLSWSQLDGADVQL